MDLTGEGARADLATLTATVWERTRGETMRRIAAVEEAVAALLGGDLAPEVGARAHGEAHKLAGSLGMLGFPEGSRLARELEQALGAGAGLTRDDGPRLAATTLLLRHELVERAANGTPATVPATPTPTPATPPPAIASDPDPPAAVPRPMSDTRLLAVDDDTLVLKVLGAMLGAEGIEVTAVRDPEAFWPALEEHAPHVVLLDLEMPGTTGIELCRALRAEERFAQLPVIFLTAHRDADVVRRIFAAGADDYVTKPIVAPELLGRISNRLERVRLYRELADRDPLTGVLNRRSSTEAIERYMRLSERYGQPLSLALLDIDNFKQLNDRHGHLLGDAVLRHLGTLMVATFRSEDVVARWGGEEFAIAMYGMGQEDGIRRIGQLLDAFAAASISDGHREVPAATFTAGIAQHGLHGDDLPALYRSADQALLSGKAQGRRRVVAATGTADARVGGGRAG